MTVAGPGTQGPPTLLLKFPSTLPKGSLSVFAFSAAGFLSYLLDQAGDFGNDARYDGFAFFD